MGFPRCSVVKNSPAKQEMWVHFLCQESPLKKKMATHSSILVWEIPWTEEPDRLQSMSSQRVGHDLEVKQQNSIINNIYIIHISIYVLNFHHTDFSPPWLNLSLSILFCLILLYMGLF